MRALTEYEDMFSMWSLRIKCGRKCCKFYIISIRFLEGFDENTTILYVVFFFFALKKYD